MQRIYKVFQLSSVAFKRCQVKIQRFLHNQKSLCSAHKSHPGEWFIFVSMGRYNRDSRVVAYRLDGSLFKVYLSARSACRSRHGHPRTIDKCLRGESSTAYGYMWRRFNVSEIPTMIDPLTKGTSTSGKVPIALINSDGSIIKIYQSIKDCSNDLNLKTYQISDVLKGKVHQVKGYQFRYLSDDKLKLNNLSLGKSYITGRKSVIQYSLDGKYIKTYSSIVEAARSLGKNVRGLQQCLNGTYSTAFGFRWKYKDLENVPFKKKRNQLIVQLDNKQKKIASFNSIKEASLSLHVSVSALNNAIRLKKTCLGFYWERK